MERLYTPWRMKYVTSAQKKGAGCVFCTKLDEGPEHDRENYVIYRGKKTVTVMNIFPYNTGHIMVLPQTHVATLAEVTPDAQFELITLISYFSDLLSQIMNPDGFNIGLNIGHTAGAGIDSHLHIHIVPRWTGDSNYMPVIGNTRVLPEELGDTYDKIVTLLRKQPPNFPPV